MTSLTPYRLSRRLARTAVLKTLFQLEFQEGDWLPMWELSLENLVDDWQTNSSETAAGTMRRADIRLAKEMIQGIIKLRPEIDEVLESFAKDWSLARMGRLERSILRLTAYELFWLQDIPPEASLDEAVELSKRYCAVEASPFINGILGNIHQHLKVLRQTDTTQAP
ncbi:MAG: transcription antitermination factor NusB [Symbiobacteriaceae bacterium]|nr:transcription antitermination factor NusB [Symbiobacteriaceae bacterium]